MYRMRFGHQPNAIIIEYHLKNYNWSEIERICETTPELMRCMLKNTNTPLHEMCNIGSAPYSLVQKVLDCWVEATITRNRHGDTPLHNRSRNAQYSSSPVRMLIMSNKKSVRMLNNTGKTPLAIACLSGACFPVIRELVIAYPEALSIRDVYGHTPLDLLWSSFAKTLPGASAISKYLDKKDKAEKEEGHGNEMSPLLGRFYEKISFCLHESFSLSSRQQGHVVDVAAIAAVDEDNESLLLCHAIVLEDLKHCPQTLIAIFLSHNNALGHQIDLNGNTALHLQIGRSLDKDCVSVLVDKCKRCTGIANNQGILPLHSALRSMKGRTDVDNIVRKIADAYTDALTVRDPITMLFPFMSAGVAGNLQMSYDFLLKSPNVVLNFIR